MHLQPYGVADAFAKLAPRKDLREGDSAEDEINTTKEEENPYWNDLALYEAVTDAVTGAKQGASGSLVYKSSAKSFIENVS